MKKVSVTVWDWPLRLFHWLLVITVAAGYATGELGGSWTDWHGRLGMLALGLIVFRLVWGLVGTTYSRFISFMPSWSSLKAYKNGDWQGAGHNPLGALAVWALLIILTLLVTTGLFANDDIGFQGPLAAEIDKSVSDKLSGWHSLLMDLLLGLVGLHLAAIGFYQWRNKTNLIKPMFNGKKQLPETQSIPSNHAVRILPLSISILIAITLAWGINQFN